MLAGARPLDALDAGCGTGFLSLELAARGHRVTGIDFAPAMLAEARRKAAERGASIRFEEADAEQLPFRRAASISSSAGMCLWTLPHPEAAIDEWIRVLRPGGRLVVIDGQFDPGFLTHQRENARTSTEYAAIGDRLPFLGGRPREEIEALLRAHGLVDVAQRPGARSGRGAGAAHGRGGEGAPDAPALCGLGRGCGLSGRGMLLRVRSITYLAQRINGYELVEPNERDLPAFAAGAHVSVRVGDGPVRDFSLWNDPAERYPLLHRGAARTRWARLPRMA